jgi:hypothetical protein
LDLAPDDFQPQSLRAPQVQRPGPRVDVLPKSSPSARISPKQRQQRKHMVAEVAREVARKNSPEFAV